MRRRKRGFEQFSLSFLDCMSCGLGAVILLFMIINHSTEVQATDKNRDVAAKVSTLEAEVLEKRQARKQLAAALEETAKKSRAAKAQAASLDKAVKDQPGEKTSDSTEQRIASLQSDLKSLESEVNELKKQKSDKGDATRSFAGQGDRQYLTGMKVGGNRILILVDASASMLGRTIVDIILRRNLSTATQLRAAKWRRAVRTVDWVTTQVPASAKFQIYVFNTEPKAVLSGTDNSWLSGASKLNAAVSAMHKVVPAGGTSLVNAFNAASRLSPPPDSIYLLTDGLPTQGAKTRGGTVSGDQRLRLFNAAVKALPRNIPVNVILFPMEGDPVAAGAFWQLALATNGSFLSPSDDWP